MRLLPPLQIICLWYLRGIYSSEHVWGDKTLPLVRPCAWLSRHLLDVQLGDAPWGGLCCHKHSWEQGREPGCHWGEDGKEKIAWPTLSKPILEGIRDPDLSWQALLKRQQQESQWTGNPRWPFLKWKWEQYLSLPPSDELKRVQKQFVHRKIIKNGLFS